MGEGCPTPGATAATFTRTQRLLLPTGARSISSRPQRQRLRRLESASVTRLLISGLQALHGAAQQGQNPVGVWVDVDR